LIGIDRYCKLGKEAQLSGCVNDVQAMAQILIDRFGFPRGQVTQLVDGAATREAILAALDGLVGRVGAGDTVVFHFAGHGSQARSLDPDEADGWDETVLPHDTGRDGDAPNLDIRDKEIHAWLERLTEVTRNVTLIFDSCHSGGISRDAIGPKARWVRRDERQAGPRLQLPRNAQAVRSRPEIGPSGWVPLGQRYVLLAGCRSCESSYEVQPSGAVGLHHGALTYFLSGQLANAGPATTYRDVFEAAAVAVTASCSLQHPQLEGEGDRTLFGLDRIEPMRFLPVNQRQGAEVTLGGGAAMGLSKGSTWAVYAPGTKRADAEGVRLGTVEIAGMQGVTSTGRVVDEAHPGAVVAGARAVELTHDYGDLALPVRIERSQPADPRQAELATAIAGSRVLRPARDGEPAGATVYRLPPRRHAADGAPVPQVKTLDEPTWAVVGAGGELVLPLCVAGPEAPRWLLENLEKRARYLVALAIRNSSSRLGEAVDCLLLHRGADGSWNRAAAGSDGLPVYVEGEALAFELVNRGPVPLYFYVLDFGLTGRIGPIYPLTGIDEPLRAGASLRVGTRAEDLMALTVPEEFPLQPPAAGADTAGQETLKVIATTVPTDFHVFYQQSYRGRRVERGGMSLLDRFLDMAAGGPMRDLTVKSRPQEDDWTAFERSFWVRPRLGTVTADGPNGGGE